MSNCYQYALSVSPLRNACAKNVASISLGNLTTEAGRPIATVHRDPSGRLFARKSISFEKHTLRTPPGIAFDNSALRQAERMGVVYFVVFDRDSKKSVCAEAFKFKRHGFPVTRGHAPQTGLGMQFWEPGTEPPRGLFDDDQDFGGMAVAA